MGHGFHYDWIRIVEPRVMPSEWFAVDLGIGEMALSSMPPLEQNWDQDQDTADHILRYAVSPEEVEEVAHREGLPPTTFARMLIIKGLREKLGAG